MRDPYDTLEVPRNASGEEIKKAHRKKSRETHPDKGGSEEEFTEVAAAYAILSNPVAREHFDRTGQAPDPTPAMSPAEQLIIATLHGAILPKGDLDDPLTGIREILNEGLSMELEKLGLAKEGEELARAQLGRFQRTDGGENLIEGTFRQMLEQANKVQADCSREIQTHEEALELLESFEDLRPVEPEPDPWCVSFGSPFRPADFQPVYPHGR